MRDDAPLLLVELRGQRGVVQHLIELALLARGRRGELRGPHHVEERVVHLVRVRVRIRVRVRVRLRLRLRVRIKASARVRVRGRVRVRVGLRVRVRVRVSELHQVDE